MSTFAWMALLAALAPPALTVRAQTVSVNDRGRLVWDVYFPRENVNSTRFADITTLDDRPVADRRDWDAPGRYIPLVSPPFRNLSMNPIEAYDRITEEEIQRLVEQTMNNQQVIQQIIGASLPQRADRLAAACYRRHEVDTFQAWASGTVTVRNPQDASKTQTVSFGFDSSRYQTAGTAWSDAGLNAYDEFLAWLEDAQDAVGAIEGALMRLTTLKAILADAPELPNGVKMTRAELASRIQDDLGSPFEFVVQENSLDVFDDGGTTKTRTKVWPTGKVAAIPQGKRVGSSMFAPVARAFEMNAQTGGAAGIDVNGVTVYYDAQNAGKQLEIQGQLNALGVPDEQLLYVIQAGV
jgi:hypothetical protein